MQVLNTKIHMFPQARRCVMEKSPKVNLISSGKKIYNNKTTNYSHIKVILGTRVLSESHMQTLSELQSHDLPLVYQIRKYIISNSFGIFHY